MFFGQRYFGGLVEITEVVSGPAASTSDTFNYSRIEQAAIDQIYSKGRDVSYVYVDPGTLNVTNDTIGGAGSTSQTVKMLITDYNRKDIDGSMVKAGDKIGLMANSELSGNPKTGDRVEDGEIWEVMHIQTVKPGSTLLFYRLQLRRGGNG